MPHRWLFIKQASRLGSLSLKSHVQVPDADIPQAAFRLTGQERTAFAGNGQVIECNVPDGSCLCPAVFLGVALMKIGSPFPHQPGALGSA